MHNWAGERDKCCLLHACTRRCFLSRPPTNPAMFHHSGSLDLEPIMCVHVVKSGWQLIPIPSPQHPLQMTPRLCNCWSLFLLWRQITSCLPSPMIATALLNFEERLTSLLKVWKSLSVIWLPCRSTSSNHEEAYFCMHNKHCQGYLGSSKCSIRLADQLMMMITAFSFQMNTAAVVWNKNDTICSKWFVQNHRIFSWKVLKVRELKRFGGCAP